MGFHPHLLWKVFVGSVTQSIDGQLLVPPRPPPHRSAGTESAAAIASGGGPLGAGRGPAPAILGMDMDVICRRTRAGNDVPRDRLSLPMGYRFAGEVWSFRTVNGDVHRDAKDPRLPVEHVVRLVS
jgi:hypothetical protein